MQPRIVLETVVVGSLAETSARATRIRDYLIDKCLVVHIRVPLVKTFTTLLVGKTILN